MKSNKNVLQFDDCVKLRGVDFLQKNDPGGFFISINGKTHIYPINVEVHPTRSEFASLAYRLDLKDSIDIKDNTNEFLKS